MAIDEDERVSDGVEAYLVELFDGVVDCEPEGVVDAVCEDCAAVVAEEVDGDSVEGVVLDFVREPVEVDSNVVSVVLSDDSGGARSWVVVGNTKVVSRPEGEVVEEEEAEAEYGAVDDAVPARADDSVLPVLMGDSQP
ncbi:hypothetical protein MKX08_003058 [Trichoderma sp. CBMAI-0020]|nr:hypothetical protein MKX08_003058 [Trichoderma sp. CBMAI-0020]